MTDNQFLQDLKARLDAQLQGQPQPPADPPHPPQPPVQPPQPSIGNTIFLGDMSSGQPGDNEIRDMVGGTTYAKRQSLSGLGGYVEFRCGYLANYDLPGFVAWLSAQPGGLPCEVKGCEPQELNGQNVSVNSVNVDLLRGIAGLSEIYFNVRANGSTGRYFQRNP
jgi:hypothetical protein